MQNFLYYKDIMDYEKGAPRNLVQFSEYNDLAFTDTGVSINDNSRPNKNVLWSSDKIEKRLSELAGRAGTAPPSADLSIRGPGGAGVSMQLPHLVGYNNPYNEYYPNGYKKYFSRDGRPFHFWRVLRPSWWLSFIIPSRAHYCDKCCNYMKHTWSSQWKDDPSLANFKCDCQSQCRK